MASSEISKKGINRKSKVVALRLIEFAYWISPQRGNTLDYNRDFIKPI